MLVSLPLRKGRLFLKKHLINRRDKPINYSEEIFKVQGRT